MDQQPTNNENQDLISLSSKYQNKVYAPELTKRGMNNAISSNESLYFPVVAKKNGDDYEYQAALPKQVELRKINDGILEVNLPTGIKYFVRPDDSNLADEFKYKEEVEFWANRKNPKNLVFEEIDREAAENLIKEKNKKIIRFSDMMRYGMARDIVQ